MIIFAVASKQKEGEILIIYTDSLWIKSYASFNSSWKSKKENGSRCRRLRREKIKKIWILKYNNFKSERSEQDNSKYFKYNLIGKEKHSVL